MTKPAKTHRSTGRLRAATAVGLAIAQPLSTRLARWTGHGTSETEQAAATEGPVTPIGAAFVIWAPLFATSLGYAARTAGADLRHEPAARRIGWLVNACLASNVLWSLNSQFRRLDRVSVALITTAASTATAAVALAEHRPAHNPHGTGSTLTRTATSTLIGPLAGWLSVATFANLETTSNLRHGRPDEDRTRRRAIALIATAAAATTALAQLLRGTPTYTAAASWGLLGIAAKNIRDHRPDVALTALAGTTLLIATTVRTRHT